MLTIAYSGKSKPSALTISEELVDAELVRDSNVAVDVNWGRYKANSQLNPDISNVTNKRRMRELFKEHDVPMPYLFTNNEDMGNGPLVGRPDSHSKGRGFWLCRSQYDVAKALRGTRKKKAATHFMEFVESEREYRVHVFKGKSIRISEKVFNEEDKTYTTGKPGDIHLRRVRDAAKLAVDAVGLDFGAVDVLASGENNEQVWVLEVNAAPGVGGSMPRLYAETFLKWKRGEFE